MTMRTYRLEDIQAARKAWADGEFADEWKPWRELAAGSGIIYPPEGSRWDSWDDDEPSQRAVLVRAMRETPHLLRTCLVGSRSWGNVVHKLLVGRDRMREDAAFASKVDAWERNEDPSNHEATQILADILNRIADSDPRRAA